MASATERLLTKSNQTDCLGCRLDIGLCQKHSMGPRSCCCADSSTGCHSRAALSAVVVAYSWRVMNSPWQALLEDIVVFTVPSKCLTSSAGDAFNFGFSEHCFSLVPLVGTEDKFHGFMCLYVYRTECGLDSSI